MEDVLSPWGDDVEAVAWIKAALPIDLPDPGELVLERDGVEYLRAVPVVGAPPSFYVAGRLIDLDNRQDRIQVYDALRVFLGV